MFPTIELFGRQIPTYGLMISLGVLVAGAIASRRVIRAGVPWENFIIIAACMLGAAMAGASLLFVLVTYSWSELVEMIRTGGIGSIPIGSVFYGGLIGGFLGALLGRRLAKEKLERLMAPVVPVIPLAHAFGRVGCFLAGCCYGIPVARPLGIAFAHPFSDAPIGVPLLPIQLIEAGLNLVISGILFWYAGKKRPNQWSVLLLYIALYAVVRFTLEFFRYDAIRGSLFSISTSQWISLALMVAAIVGFVWIRRSPKEKAGQESST